MSKLKNVKAIQDMLSGTHKSQTRKSHYFGTSNDTLDDKHVIEKFENGEPRIWIEEDHNGNRTRVTQNDGFKSRESESGYLVRQAQKDLQMPSECPKCGNSTHTSERRLNEKFWMTHKQCFDCVVKFETLLRNDKEAWIRYSQQKMHNNAVSFFKDADEDVKGLEKMMTDEIRQVQNADGDIEQYDAAMSKEKFKDTVLQKYKEYKQTVLDRLKEESK